MSQTTLNLSIMLPNAATKSNMRPLSFLAPNLTTLLTILSPSHAETIRLLMSMQVDRLKQQRIFWSGNYLNPNSHEYQTLEDESNYAVS